MGGCVAPVCGAARKYNGHQRESRLTKLKAPFGKVRDELPIEQFEIPTLAQHRENLAKAGKWRERLASIDSTALGDDDLITWEILEFQLADDGTNDDDYWLRFDITPYVGPYLFRFSEQALATQQFADKAAADHYLELVGDYASLVEHMSDKIAGQVERGIYLPKPALPSTRATWAIPWSC